MAKGKIIPFRADEIESAYAIDRAGRDGVTVSAFIRRLIREEKQREEDRASGVQRSIDQSELSALMRRMIREEQRRDARGDRGDLPGRGSDRAEDRRRRRSRMGVAA